jgi:hypothetical protein
MDKWAIDVLASKAYAAYHDYLDKMVGLSGGEKSPPFDELSQETRAAWADVVCEIICSYPIITSDIADCDCRNS